MEIYDYDIKHFENYYNDNNIRGVNAMHACRKTIAFLLRNRKIESNSEYSVVMRRKRDGKLYYYQVFIESLDAPVVKIIKGKEIIIKNNIAINKIDKKLV